MANRVSIIMYHFVRDLKRSRYPEIKGLDLEDFIGQIDYIRRCYNVIGMDELMHAVYTKEYELPPRALLLTFDDGYIDHFTNVFPVLDKYGIQGCFFPPAKAITEHRVLDVNKIHFTLASVPDKSRIIEFISAEIAESRKRFLLESPEYYYEKLAVPNRYDSGEVIFIKRVLQRELPEAFRNETIDKLFRQFVTRDEESFARELYMSPEQLCCMHRNGMHIGSHGYDHYWLNTLSPDEQVREIDRSLDFLGSLGCSLDNWVMCYPYGGYNESLLDLLKERGCGVGLATHVAIADLSAENPLALPRLDTNDLPKQEDAAPNEWTIRAGGDRTPASFIWAGLRGLS